VLYTVIAAFEQAAAKNVDGIAELCRKTEPQRIAIAA